MIDPSVMEVATTHQEGGGEPVANEVTAQNGSAEPASESAPSNGKRKRASQNEMDERQKTVVTLIATTGPTDSATIGEKLGLTYGQTNTLLQHMRKEGKITTSTPADGDKRKVQYVLKSKGSKTPKTQPIVADHSQVKVLSAAQASDIVSLVRLGSKLEVVGIRRDRLDLLVGDGREISVLLSV